tara:strand:- start:266 stop:472 length:207 start_codon:yes stop_codon:yes gene_type:complete
MRQLTLVKGRKTYVFRYEIGQEDRVIDYFEELVENPDCRFDGLDAKVLAAQLGEEGKEGDNLDFIIVV